MSSPLADMPDLLVNIETPSGAGPLGYLIFGDSTYGKFGTGKFGVPYVSQSSYVRSCHVARGSSDPSDAMFHAQAGSASVVLDDRTRVFDPANDTDIRPKRAVHIQAVWSATTYNLFTGVVGEWGLAYPSRWAGHGDATTTANCVDATQYLVDLNLGDATFPQELTGARVSATLDAADIPASLRSIDTGQTTMPASTQGSVSGWSILLEAADSELGEAYVAADGTVTFRDRQTVVTASRTKTSQATFGDGGGAEIPFYDVTLSYDDKRIRNHVTVVYNEQNAQTEASDAVSLSRYGEKPYQLQTLISSRSVAQDIANTILDLYKDPLLRIDTLTLKPRHSPTTTWPAVLSRELGDRITVKVTPPGGGSRISRDCIVRGIEHSITANGEWDVVFTLQDASLFGSYIIFGTSQFDGTDGFWF